MVWSNVVTCTGLFVLCGLSLVYSLTDSCESEIDVVVCQSKTATSQVLCETNGFYCSGESETTLVKHQFGVSECVVAAAVPCPAGYYCPSTSEKKRCDIGHFCPQASDEQSLCTLGEISCPTSGQDSQNSSNLTLFFFLVFAFFIVTATVLNSWLIRVTEAATDKIVDVAKKHETTVALTARDNLRSLLSMRSLDSLHSEKRLKIFDSYVSVRSDESEEANSSIQQAYIREYDKDSSRLMKYMKKRSSVMLGSAKWASQANMPRGSVTSIPRGSVTSIPRGSVTSIPRGSVTSIPRGEEGAGGGRKSIPRGRASVRMHPNPALLKSSHRVYSSVAKIRGTGPSISNQPGRDISVNGASELALLGVEPSAPAPMMAAFRVQDEAYMPAPVDNPLDVVFKGLYLNLKTTGACILQNLCGTLVHGTITALMGPSGAGKTTLLSLLRGQAYFAETAGTLMVNGCRCSSLQSFASSIAYVSQVDVMYEELTCEENIICAALLFNRRNYASTTEILPMVYYALELLGLMLIRRSPVGNEDIKGISGGQKKRVSVAMEMMKEAPLFLLDEPTSGLDSASSINLFNALHTLAYLGHNIVATIHQPRSEIVALFDNLILLAPGGRMVYCGPAQDMSLHFSAMGYTVKPESNIADFVMDVLAGFVKKDLANSADSSSDVSEALCKWWERNKYPALITEIDSIPETEKAEEEDISFEDYMSAIFLTLLVVMLRHLRTFQRTLPTFRFTCVVFFVLGFVVSLLFGELELSRGSAGQILTQASAMQLTFGLLSLTFGLSLFKNDALIRRREEEGGLWLGPYVVGKLAGCIPELFVYPLMFLFGYYPFVHSAAPFTEMWALLFFFQISVLGLANFIAVCVPGSSTNLVANGTLVIFWAFGGIEPTLPTIRERMGIFGEAINMMSPFRWSFERMVVAECKPYSDYYSPVIGVVLDELEYEYGDKSEDTVALVVYYLIGSLLTYLWLTWARDHFKYWRDFTDYIRTIRWKVAAIVSTSSKSNGAYKEAAVELPEVELQAEVGETD